MKIFPCVCIKSNHIYYKYIAPKLITDILLNSEVPLYEDMRKEDEYVSNCRGSLASFDVKLKFYLVQLFQNAQKNQFLSSPVMSCDADAYIHPPLFCTPLWACNKLKAVIFDDVTEPKTCNMNA